MRGKSEHSAALFEWLAMRGFCAISSASQKVRSLAWDMSTATPRRWHSRTYPRPRSVRPEPGSMAAPHRALSLFQHRFSITTPYSSRASRRRLRLHPSSSAPSTESRAAILPAALALLTSCGERQRTAMSAYRPHSRRSRAAFASKLPFQTANTCAQGA